MQHTKHHWGHLALPGVFLLAGLLTWPFTDRITELPVLLHWLPPLWLVLGIALSTYFCRSKVTYALVVLATAHGLLVSYLPSHYSQALPALLVYASTCFVLPLLFWLIANSEEMRLTSYRSLGLLVLVSLPLVMLLFINWYEADTWPLIIRLQPLPGHWLGSGTLPQLALLLFLAVGLMLMLRSYQHGEMMDWVLSVVTLLCLLALRDNQHAVTLSLLLNYAMLMLLVSLLQNSYYLAWRDDRTGLPGRRALRDYLYTQQQDYTLARVDLDYFQRFNYLYGYDAGNQALRYVASQLKQLSRLGRAFRYGPDEFIVVFPKRGSEEVIASLDAIRYAISKRLFTTRARDRRRNQILLRRRDPARRVSVTVSVGVAQWDKMLATHGELIRAAGEAMRAAREQGGNRTLNYRDLAFNHAVLISGTK